MPKWLVIAGKDVRVLTRSRGALLILLAFPSVLILILGFAFSGRAGKAGRGGIPVAVVNLDRGDVGAQIADRLLGNPELAKFAKMEKRTDGAAVRAAIERGDITAALIIPAGFSADIAGGRPTRLDVLQDPGSDIAAAVWTGVVRSVAGEVAGASVAVRVGIATAVQALGPAAIASLPSLTASAVTLARAEGAGKIVAVRTAETALTMMPTLLDYYAASMTAMFLLFGCVYGAFSFVDERQSRTFARLLASPTSRAAVVGGKLLAVLLLGAGQFAVLYVFTRLTLRANWGNDPTGLVLVVLGELIATVGLTALIASVAGTRRAVGGTAPVVVQVMALLGGAFFPVSIFPVWFKPVQYVSFVGWAMDGFVKLQHGASAAMVLPNFGVPAAIGLALFALGVWRMRTV